MDTRTKRPPRKAAAGTEATAPRTHARLALPPFDASVLVLQGGGALGAYQAGVYETLLRCGHAPHWVAGVSIGAINSALIAGNPPERRVARLREFWDLLSSQMTLPPPAPGPARALFNSASALHHALLGVPGMYRPRATPSILQRAGTPGALGIYDTGPLRQTLLRLVDFDLINSKRTRLSVGAVNVRNGNSIYFDNTVHEIRPEHVMASAALPPAFPPVEIDGEAYWDGGILSNTPLQYVLDVRDGKSLMVLSVDLFPARGTMPDNLSEVVSRQKDITYSSRTRYNADMLAKLQNGRQAVREALQALPAELLADPGVQRLHLLLQAPPVNILHLIYRQQRYESESRDYEFSRASVSDHWQAGVRDMTDSIEHPEWLKESGLDDGVVMRDLERPAAPG